MAKPPYLNVLADAAALFADDEPRARWIVKKLKEAGYAITPHIGQHTRPMWVALDGKNRVQATWYRGCIQPWAQWRRAIRGLGYHPVKVQVTFPW